MRHLSHITLSFFVLLSCADGGSRDCPGCETNDVVLADVAPDVAVEVESHDRVAPAEVVPSPPVRPCEPCSSDSECGALQCAELVASHHCLMRCDDGADCDSGWRCYKRTGDAGVCVPSTFDCHNPCLVTGCDDGLTCDQWQYSETYGQCVPAGEPCERCALDWQCGPGRRCLEASGYFVGDRDGFCVAECDSLAPDCEDWAVCREMRLVEAGSIDVCVPWHPTCCGPDCGTECDPPCSGILELCDRGRCVQCITDGDCSGTDEVCNPATRRCAGGPCSDLSITPFEAPSGECVQCLKDTHCGRGRGPCLDHWCLFEESSPCKPPYPWVAVVDGIPICASCVLDEHCHMGATCDPETFRCVIECDQDCVTNGCPPSHEFDLQCDLETGCCYDRRGLCDNLSAFCNSPGASACVPFDVVFEDGVVPGGGVPGVPPYRLPSMGMCSCDLAATAVCAILPDSSVCQYGGRCHDGADCFPNATLQWLLQQAGDGTTAGKVAHNLDYCVGGLIRELFAE